MTMPVTVAWSFWQRVRGLLGRPCPPPGHGFLIPCCHAVHTLGMRYAIDIVFLDSDYRVLRVCERVPPGRYARCAGAKLVIELAPDAARSMLIKPNDVLLLAVLGPLKKEGFEQQEAA